MTEQKVNGRPEDWPATSGRRWAVPVYRVVLRLLSRYHAEGVENLPEPPYIVASNHMSYFDVPSLVPLLPRNVVGLAGAKYRGTWREFLFTLNAVIWVEQFSADREALKAAMLVLRHGYPLGIAPEGTRSKVGALIEGREGTAFIATRTNVPIVPCGLWGTEKVLRHPRPAVHVRLGKPIWLPEGRAKGPELEAYTEQIMCAIAALLPERYHGFYAGNPLIEEMRERVT